MLSYWKLDDPSVFIEDLEWFDKSIHSSVFKRIQSPPNIITSTSAFGYDLRESMLPYRQSDRYKKLKALLVVNIFLFLGSFEFFTFCFKVTV